MGAKVLLFIPNIIGYVRIVLASIAFYQFQEPVSFCCFYISSIILDWFDGYFARKLNQTSQFGAWFDVVIDLFSRGYLWCALSRVGYLVIMVEWLAFVCTHSRGENWKIPDEKFPALVKMVMSHGFHSPMGIYAIGSLHVLPLWLYGYESRLLTDVMMVPIWLQLTIVAFLSVGRTVCFFVEGFYILNYVNLLLHTK